MVREQPHDRPRRNDPQKEHHAEVNAVHLLQRCASLPAQFRAPPRSTPRQLPAARFAATPAAFQPPDVPARYSCLVSSRRNFPLEVFGMLPGGTNSTRSGGNPSPRDTSSVTAADIAARFAASASRDSATTTIFSVPAGLVLHSKRHYAAFANPLHPRRQLFHLVRIQIPSALDDDVLHSPGHVHLAIRQIRPVARIHPSIFAFSDRLPARETSFPSPLRSGNSRSSPTARETTKILPSVPPLRRPSSSTTCTSCRGIAFPAETNAIAVSSSGLARLPLALPTRKLRARRDPPPAPATSAAPSPPAKPPPVHKPAALLRVEIHISQIASQIVPAFPDSPAPPHSSPSRHELRSTPLNGPYPQFFARTIRMRNSAPLLIVARCL